MQGLLISPTHHKYLSIHHGNNSGGGGVRSAGADDFRSTRYVPELRQCKDLVRYASNDAVTVANLSRAPPLLLVLDRAGSFSIALVSKELAGHYY